MGHSNIIKKRREFEWKNITRVNDLLHEYGRFMGIDGFTATFGVKLNQISTL